MSKKNDRRQDSVEMREKKLEGGNVEGKRQGR